MSNDSALQNVAANIQSLDGKIVVNYAQWQSLADFQAMRKNSDAESNIQAVAGLAQFEPVVCEVVDAIETAPREGMYLPVRFRRLGGSSGTRNSAMASVLLRRGAVTLYKW